MVAEPLLAIAEIEKRGSVRTSGIDGCPVECRRPGEVPGLVVFVRLLKWCGLRRGETRAKEQQCGWKDSDHFCGREV